MNCTEEKYEQGQEKDHAQAVLQAAGRKTGLQVQEIRDMVRRAMVQPKLREQERKQTEKHRKETNA